ncbi:Cytosolic iron-sulfur assembly component 2B [Microbotryomycetes sp. NB124-2]
MPDNANPVVHKSGSGVQASRRHARVLRLARDEDDDDAGEWTTVAVNGASADVPQLQEIDREEVFDLIRSISDPEHPLTLEQLAVVSAPQITVNNGSRPSVLVEFTPTIPHCSMATLIGRFCFLFGSLATSWLTRPLACAI